MTLSDSLKAGAAAAAAATLLAVAISLQAPGAQLLPDGGDPAAGLDAGAAASGYVRAGVAPLGSWAVWSTSLASPAAQAAVGLDGGGVQRYVRARVCALDVDGGRDPGPLGVPGLDIVYDDAEVLPCAPGDAVLEAWVQGVPGAPWACACSPGPGCLVDGGAAPLGVTLATWSGACVPKPCVERAGVSSWPAECPGGAP